MGDAVIFNGDSVKALKDDLLLGDTARILTGSSNPTSVATLGQKGSLYLRQRGVGDGEAYVKLDDGETTNWDLIQTLSNTQLVVLRAMVTDADGFPDTSITTAEQIEYLSDTTGVTGTGDLVLATGPIIGLVNATGLPLTTGVTGTLPVGNGGTGAASLTDHGVMLGSGTGAVTVTAVGATGQVLTGVTGADPVWAAPATSGTVTSVGVSGGTTGLTTSGGPVTTSGVITLSGTLVVANGGTGVTSATGTGSVVLSTSPTLVTPALGTPASGVATNITGLPLTSGVTGVLGAANGGTGVANNAAATLTRSGNHDLAITTLGATAVTMPLTGHLLPAEATVVATDANATLTVDSGRYQMFTGFSTSRDVTLPTTSVAAGDTFRLANTTAFDMVVKASNGNALTIANSTNMDATARNGFTIVTALQATPTTPAHWRVIEVYEQYTHSSTFSANGAGGGTSAAKDIPLVRHNKNCLTVLPNPGVVLSSTPNTTNSVFSNTATPTRFWSSADASVAIGSVTINAGTATAFVYASSAGTFNYLNNNLAAAWTHAAGAGFNTSPVSLSWITT